ncbi:PREDICTED: general transcription factor IIH subunit 1 isoform X1 [Rhagoletis zephyria]|uniref:general transcription factor IIH subunit 1 isoform X1 n=2 Tax=Rhagoletis zephyria TaxID=28612 RepID=UPI00081124DA|nr:PREDICTED: general transcription factor IIH subunit 1 isoform X1 [Rhagoletis zephyria]XP_017472870.1 PREDICTED: general transcription factor IIH subunit 1 isoform X1 [Rhagoletis zephyria]
MTTSSEDVLLQMGEVRYKKGDGTLYVMNERLAWMAENRDTVAVSHRFADIKMQKISPEGKPKVQLQVVLHDGNSSTFHFVNRDGQQAMLADRDKVKELLQQLLPNFKRKVDKELEEKNRILSENPNLLQLYKDLVITQVLTSEEFWATHAKEHAMKNVNKKQDIGVSGAFLADIKPQTDGCNGLKYNLTPDIILCIFKTYPAVKRKHQENVPAKLSEAEFWTKFFQSHYFHRDRITAGSKDIFTECGKIDDQTLKAAVQQGAGDPLLDLKQFEDVPLEEGFGSVNGNRNIANSGNIVHQNMIKRFNQHSIMVLKTCADVAGSSTSTANGPAKIKDARSTEHATANGGTEKSKHSKDGKGTDADNHVAAHAAAGSPLRPTKRQRIMEKIHFEDLGDPLIESADANDANKKPKKSQQLSLAKEERYLHGPVPITGYDMQEDPRRMEEVQYHLMRATETWTQRTPHKVLVSSTAAVNALGELSPGGALMRGFHDQSAGQLVPPDFEKDLRNLYLSLSELLKHFWNSFPPTTAEAEEKAMRMHEALQRFKMAKLVPFESRALHELSPLGASLTQHLNRLLQAANAKFVTWQDRKMRQHR